MKTQKNILIGITGGIAAYKIADLTSMLCKRGHTVQIVMTENAKKFITPLTMSTISKHPVLDDSSEWIPDGKIKHIELAKWAYMYVIAPATANTIIKLASGAADNLLSSIYLALPMEKRVMFFPAMNTNMLDSMPVQKNISELERRPLHKVVPPVEGTLACGDTGRGKLPSVDFMADRIEGFFGINDL